MSLKSLVRLAIHTQLLPVLESGEETTLVGGQAVMEGVMMRAPHSYCVAVRKASGEIVTETNPLGKVSDRYPIFRFPVIRGLGTLGQAMWLGGKALKFSLDAAIDTPTSGDPAASNEKTEIPKWMMTMNLILSLAFFLFTYKFLPLFLATQLQKPFPVLHGRIAFNLVDGGIRLAIFLSFLFLISRAKDIHRVFQYHGAEHKVVFNFESGKPVTVKNAQSFTTLHPRCGTSFLIVVMLLSIPVYTLLPFDGFAAKLIARIALLPFIIGLSYELIRYVARNQKSFLSVLTAPGLWLQRITTQPPTDEDTAIAIQALEGAMELEKAQGGELVIA